MQPNESPTCPHCGVSLVTEHVPAGTLVICSECRSPIANSGATSRAPISRKAIASVCLGIAAVFVSCIAGIPAIVLGVLALRDIRSSSEKVESLRGKQLAMAGIATGTLFGVICAPMMLMISVPIAAAVRTAMASREPIVRAASPELTIAVPFAATRPKIDGEVDTQVYGPAFRVEFTDDSNPGVLWERSAETVKTPENLSFELRAAYTAESLYLAVQVYDDVVYGEDPERVWQNDSIEIFIDGDRNTNDFLATERRGNAEGFQLLADVNGKKSGSRTEIPLRAWRFQPKRTSDGYIGEFAVPLDQIDTHDGPGDVPAKAGSLLMFNLLLKDFDGPGSGSDASFWAGNSVRSRPYFEGENIWAVALELVPPEVNESVE